MKIDVIVRAVMSGTYGFVPQHLFFDVPGDRIDPTWYVVAPKMAEIAAQYLGKKEG